MPSTGNLNLRTGTDPAANVEIAETLTSLDTCRLQFFKVTLVTDANVATRTVTFSIQDSAGNTLFTRVSPATQAASLTRNYYFYADLVTEDSSFSGTDIKLCIPSNRWPRGAKLVTSCANRQATDNYGAPALFVEEFHG
jgi:hypothetical protein